ncbi:MAG: hypothetical protein IPM42_13350 [Saprospiraceae bacterium]|nr:hypothetical protein [Saprospiraceae bacterium]
MKKVFIKDLNKNLPFKINTLLKYLYWDNESKSDWNMVAFTHYKGEEFEVTNNNTQRLIELLSLMVKLLDDNNNWIIFHGAKRKWFIENHQDRFISKNLSNLKKLFIENNINFDFVGGIELSTIELISIFYDLIMYPFDQRFDIFISKKNFPFVIQLNQHYEVDILSTDIKIIKSVVDNCNLTKKLNIRIARGTLL